MNAIRINNFEKTHTGYRVTLGNGVITDFTTLKDVKQFLCETSRFLTCEMFTLNEYYTQTHIIYCSARFLFEKYLDGVKIKTLLDTTESHMTSAYRRSTHANGNYFAFVNLIKGVECNKEAVRNLAKLYDKQSNTYLKYKLMDIKKGLDAVQSRLENCSTYPELKDSENIPNLGNENKSMHEIHYEEGLEYERLQKAK